MKTHTVIADANGQRKVTSTTETLRIKASEIEPGDWLLKPHGRVMRKDKLVTGVYTRAGVTYITFQLCGAMTAWPGSTVNVERTR